MENVYNTFLDTMMSHIILSAKYGCGCAQFKIGPVSFITEQGLTRKKSLHI